jgi:hypothetical protein
MKIGPTPEFCEAYWRVMARYGVIDRATEQTFANRGGFDDDGTIWNEVREEHARIVRAT